MRANQLLERNDFNALIVLGDFNDVPEAATTQILNGPSGSEIGTRGFNLKDKGDDARLFNLAPAIAAERRFSRIHRGRGELLDQIFASEQFFPRDADNNRTLPTEVDCHVDFRERLPSIEDNPNERIGEVTPDHAPVTATFDLP
jgi:endonuclease/exonuclease/phosphatase family metal-dependent hydrolase